MDNELKKSLGSIEDTVFKNGQELKIALERIEVRISRVENYMLCTMLFAGVITVLLIIHWFPNL